MRLPASGRCRDYLDQDAVPWLLAGATAGAGAGVVTTGWVPAGTSAGSVAGAAGTAGAPGAGAAGAGAPGTAAGAA
ncbi:hypothetical protein, partial [Mycolicibacterium neworleansense]|uniref:hypothetical protein n=1 Tax=Mycolicibacterium neworleansense TaxID=146018 RepID=UPI0021F38F61